MKLVALANSHRDKSETLEDPASKRVFPLLVEHASYALRAGVRLSFDDYLGLDPLERLAFVHAGDRLRAQDAARHGVAASSLVGAAVATAEFDDCAALESLLAGSLHDKAVAEASDG